MPKWHGLRRAMPHWRGHARPKSDDAALANGHRARDRLVHQHAPCEDICADICLGSPGTKVAVTVPILGGPRRMGALRVELGQSTRCQSRDQSFRSSAITMAPIMHISFRHMTQGRVGTAGALPHRHGRIGGGELQPARDGSVGPGEPGARARAGVRVRDVGGGRGCTQFRGQGVTIRIAECRNSPRALASFGWIGPGTVEGSAELARPSWP